MIALRLLLLGATVFLAKAQDQHLSSNKDSASSDLPRRLNFDRIQAILCLEVQEIAGIVLGEAERGEPDDDEATTYSCVLDARHTGGLTGLMAHILDPSEAFIASRESAKKDGKTILYAVGGVLSPSKGILTLPDDGSKSLQWIAPELVPTMGSKGSRTVGNRKVIVVRMTASDGGIPSNSAEEMADAVFGYLGNSVNMFSQYAACSNDQLTFSAVTGSTPNGYTITNGVVEVTTPIVTSSAPTEHANEAITILGDLYAMADHVLFVAPFGSLKDGSTGWAAFASKPGSSGWYNDGYIMPLNVLMHETGHNLDLSHSGEGADQYYDYTCHMGAPYVDSICFNAAKMSQFQWFEDRNTYVYPGDGGSFGGYVIGINDYTNSILMRHSLIVTIVIPDTTYRYYITYNRAEGINGDAREAVDQVTVVYTDSSGWPTSDLVAKLSAGDSYEIADFGGSGDPLVVTVDSVGLDTGADGEDTVDVALVNIQFNGLPPSPTPQPTPEPTAYKLPTCGNGVCDTDGGETCFNCEEDCIVDEDCVVFAFSPESTFTWAVYYDSRAGLMFNVDTVTDIYVYEIKFFLVGNPNTVTSTTVSVYTREGSYDGFQSSSDGWELVADSLTIDGIGTGVSYATEIHQFDVPIDPTFMAAGEKRAFYVTSEATAEVYYCGSSYDALAPDSAKFSNDDITIYDGIRVAFDFVASGTSMTPKGEIAYTYAGLGGSPSDSPTSPTVPTPSPTASPSTTPSGSPTKTPTGPTASPTMSPTAAPFPTASPTMSPTESPVVTPTLTPTVSSCGDNVCDYDVGETCYSCSDDCSGSDCGTYEFSPASEFTWATYYDDRPGLMYNVKALKNLYAYEITFFLVGLTETIDSATISIYTREGSYDGFQSSSSGWELVADSVTASGTGTGVDYETEIYEFTVPFESSFIELGELRAFYVTAEVGADVFYVGSSYDGSAPDTEAFAGDDIIVYDGIRMGYPFSSSSTTMRPKGGISYVYGEVVPTDAPSPEPTPAPTPEPTPTRPSGSGGSDNGFPCYSSTTVANVRDTGLVEMSKLRVGDEVLTADGSFKTVYAIDHFHKSKPTEFLQIHTTVNGEKPLELTELHMLFVEGKSHPIPASLLQVGDAVKSMTPSGEVSYERVTKIVNVISNGFYNALTEDGTIVVDGVVGSSYPAITEKEYFEVAGVKLMSIQAALQLALTPVRAVCLGVSLDLCRSDEHVEEHFAWYSQLGNWALLFWQEQYGSVQVFLGGAALLLLGAVVSVAVNIAVAICSVGRSASM